MGQLQSEGRKILVHNNATSKNYRRRPNITRRSAKITEVHRRPLNDFNNNEYFWGLAWHYAHFGRIPKLSRRIPKSYEVKRYWNKNIFLPRFWASTPHNERANRKLTPTDLCRVPAMKTRRNWANGTCKNHRHYSVFCWLLEVTPQNILQWHVAKQEMGSSGSY